VRRPLSQVTKDAIITGLRKQEVRFLGRSHSLEVWVYDCVRMVKITDGWGELMTLCLESKLKHQ
jgi:hypothetical protein